MRTPKIKQRVNGKFYMVYIDMNGKRQRKSLRTRDYTQAKLRFIAMCDEAPATESAAVTVTPVPTMPNTSVGTLNQGMDFIIAYNTFMYSKYDIKDAWEAKKKGKIKSQCVKKSTVMRGTLKRFQEHSGVFCVSEIKYHNLQSFADMLSRRVSNASLNNHIQRLRRFLQFCVNHDWVIKNEANNLDRLKEKTPTRYSFSKEEIEMIWEKMHPQFLPYYQLMFKIGLRAGDMWNLTKDNFLEGKEGMELHVEIGKTERWLRVPVSSRAKEKALAIWQQVERQ